MKEYLDKIKPYLKDTIIDLQETDTWKIQLAIAISFISLKDAEEEHVMHAESDNKKFMSLDNVNDVIDELFWSLFSRYQNNLETSMRGKDFIFDSVQVLHYKFHKVNFRRGGSYIDSSDRIKKKKATINPKSKDDKCFQYATTVVLSYLEIQSHLERVSSIKSFINKYKWKRIDYP